jgi:hypothetical protein
MTDLPIAGGPWSVSSRFETTRAYLSGAGMAVGLCRTGKPTEAVHNG